MSRGKRDERSTKNKSKSVAKEQEKLIDKLLQLSLHCNPGSVDELSDIDAVINKICDNEKDPTVVNLSDREEHFKKFLVWCETNDVDVTKVEVFQSGESENDYGLRAKVNITEDELLMTIPRKLMLTTENALEDAKLAKFVEEDAIVKTMPNVLLALHLLNECFKEKSYWKPYIDIFPKSYTTPLYMSANDLKALKPSPWFEEVVKLRRSIGRQYAYFWKQINLAKSSANNLPFKTFFTYDAYRWAVSTVMTRQNFIPASDGKSMINALIPLWDMCNHNNGKYSTDYDVEKNAALCYAMKSFDAKLEIMIFYGNRSNGEFFIHNGFVYEDNINDYIPIKLGISKNDPLFSLRTQLCVKLGIQSCGSFKLAPKVEGKPVDATFLAFLRIFHMSKEQLDKYLITSESLLNQGEQNFPEIDEKLFTFLRIRTKLLQRAYEQECDHEVNDVIQSLLKSELSILQSYDLNL